VNDWNRVDLSIRRLYLGAAVFFAVLIAAAFLRNGDMPLWLLQFAGVLLLLLCVSQPVLHVVESLARRGMDSLPPSSGPATCAFCLRNQDELHVLMAGPSQYLCSGCIRDAWVSLSPADGADLGGASILCSFCGAQRAVGAVMVRNEIAICAPCARLASSSLDAAELPGS
jgi:hypothetical protein